MEIENVTTATSAFQEHPSENSLGPGKLKFASGNANVVINNILFFCRQC